MTVTKTWKKEGGHDWHSMDERKVISRFDSLTWWVDVSSLTFLFNLLCRECLTNWVYMPCVCNVSPLVSSFPSRRNIPFVSSLYLTVYPSEQFDCFPPLSNGVEASTTRLSAYHPKWIGGIKFPSSFPLHRTDGWTRLIELPLTNNERKARLDDREKRHTSIANRRNRRDGWKGMGWTTDLTKGLNHWVTTTKGKESARQDTNGSANTARWGIDEGEKSDDNDWSRRCCSNERNVLTEQKFLEYMTSLAISCSGMRIENEITRDEGMPSIESPMYGLAREEEEKNKAEQNKRGKGQHTSSLTDSGDYIAWMTSPLLFPFHRCSLHEEKRNGTHLTNGSDGTLGEFLKGSLSQISKGRRVKVI